MLISPALDESEAESACKTGRSANSNLAQDHAMFTKLCGPNSEALPRLYWPIFATKIGSGLPSFAQAQAMSASC